MKYAIFLLIILSLLDSCTVSNRDKEEQVCADTVGIVEKKEKPVDIGRRDIPIYDELSGIKNKLSDIADGIEFCALSSEPLLDGSRVDDVTLTDSDIFVIWTIEAVYRFDNRGVFKNKIGSLGQGPEEYVQVGNGLLVDGDRETVTVIDVGQLKMKTYDYNGVFLKSASIGRYTGSLVRMDAETYIVRTTSSEFHRPNCPIIRLMDATGKVIKTYKSSFYPIPKDNVRGWHYGPMESSLWEYDGHFYTLEYGNDTIFRIEKDQLLADRTLSGSKYRPSKHDLFHSGSGEKRLLCPIMMRPNSGIFESDRFVLFRCYEEGRKVYFGVYDKTDGKVYQSLHENAPLNERRGEKRSDYFIDDLVSGMPFKPEYSSGNKIIGWLSASDIVENRDKILQFVVTRTSEEAIRFREIVTNITDEDNPVLMIVKLK